MSQTKTGKTEPSNPTPKPVKTTSKVKTQGFGSSTPAKSTKSASPVKPIKTGQRRELWVLSCLGITVLLSLAAFGKGGVLPEALHRLTLGLMGWGAYIAPFSALISMLFILYARGKPVKNQIIGISLTPFLISASIHILVSRYPYTLAHCALLYQNGIFLSSGGFICGGFAELAVRLLSRVGAVFLMLALLAMDVLMISQVRFIVLVDTLIEFFEMRRISRGHYPEEEENSMNPFEEDADDADDASASPMRHSDSPAAHSEEPPRQEHGFKRLFVRPNVSNTENAAPVTSAQVFPAVREIPIKSKPSPNSRSVPDIPLDAVAPDPQKAMDSDWPSGTLEKRAPHDHSPEEPPNEVLFSYKTKPRPAVPSSPTPYALEHWATASAAEAFSAQKNDADSPPWEASQPAREHRKVYDIPLSPQMPATSAAQTPSDVTVADKKRNDAAGSPAVTEDLQVVDTHMQERPIENKSALKNVIQSVPGKTAYHLPSVNLLREPVNTPSEDITNELRERSQILSDALVSFGVSAQIIGAIRGPSVTRYELQLDPGVKLSRLTSLQNDIALALGATGVRIAPIPDKQAVGIEVPNKVVQTVYLREVLLSPNMSREKSPLAFALGRDITGNSIVANIHKMPHLLIAGTTGSGKSVCINSIIVSLLYRTTPRDVRFIMIDPKMVELGNYNGIPHLLIPVVTDYKKAPGTLAWAVAEMERRYKLMAEAGARELTAYNEMLARNDEEPLPKIVIIIDELADLMMVAAKDIEEAICRIAQKARAAGMHLIIATQRPSADVLTGLMKSNIPSRIAFAVASQTESRIILDQGGADKLIGRGDMLFLPIGEGKPLRVQGCFLSDGEIERITDDIKAHNSANYSQEIIDQIENANKNQGTEAPDDDEADPLIGDAIDIFMENGQASASMLQRRMKVGYARAARIIDQIEARGIIGPPDGSHSRPILISKMDWEEMKLRYGVRS